MSEDRYCDVHKGRWELTDYGTRPCGALVIELGEPQACIPARLVRLDDWESIEQRMRLASARTSALLTERAKLTAALERIASVCPSCDAGLPASCTCVDARREAVDTLRAVQP